MNNHPETRESLLLRLSDVSDAAAWNEFVSMYQPMLYRLAVRRGLQPNDADDVTQQVLMSVARAVEGWQQDSERGSFRSWLHVVARNANQQSNDFLKS